MLSGDTQVPAQVIELGDGRQLVTSLNQRRHAQPARKGDNDCEQQHQTEADTQFQADTYISEASD
jgi:hypothetical protein